MMEIIFMSDEIYHKAESSDIQVMGLFCFGNSPTEHTITDLFEGVTSNPGTAKTVLKIERNVGQWQKNSRREVGERMNVNNVRFK